MSTLATREKKAPAPINKRSLAATEKKINQRVLDGFMSYVDTGLLLWMIKDEGLFEQAGFKSFPEYVNSVDEHGKRFPFDAREADRMIKLSREYESIENALKQLSDAERDLIPLPANQEQLRAFQRFEPGQVGDLWIRGAREASKAGIEKLTGNYFVEWLNNGGLEIEATNVSSSPTYVAPPVEEEESDIDLAPPPPPVRKRRSEVALATLDRIEQFSTDLVFPPGAKQAILDDLLVMTDWELEKWGSQADDDFAQIGRLVFRARFSISQAMNFHARQIKYEESSVMDLIHYAIKKGGGITWKVDALDKLGKSLGLKYNVVVTLLPKPLSQ